MKTSLKIGGLVAAMMLAVSGASFAADQVSPYVHSADGQIVKSGFGLCWRTNFWTLKSPVKVASATPMFSLPKPASRSRPPLRLLPLPKR